MSNKKFHLPVGYSLPQAILRSYRFLKNPVKFIDNSMKRFGGTYSAIMPPRRTLILTQNASFISYVLRKNHTNYQKSEFSSNNAAKYFGKGLLFSNGPEWLRQRRLIQPGFHQKKIQELNEIVIRSIEQYLENFPVGRELNVYPLVHQLSFNIVIKSLFDINLSAAIMQELGETFNAMQDFLLKEINQPYRKWLYPFTRSDKKNAKRSGRIRDIFRSIMQQRIADTGVYNDLLDMLLSARYEDTGKPMPEEQILDEILVLVFAGHETTANSLSWLLHLLAEHPAVMEKLTAAVNSTSVQESPRNEYITAVINEGMRLFPAAWMTERVALKDDTFGTYSFPAGTIIIPFFYGLHRDPAIWEDANQFKPDRFLTQQEGTKKNEVFFPFGAGPRMCIGNNFAMTEMSFFLHRFFTKFSISSTGHIPEMKPLITLRPDKVILNVHQR
jgi:cytochrome P450